MRVDLNHNVLVIFLVLLISICEAGAQSISYLSYTRNSNLLFVLAWVIYLAIVYLLWRSYHYRGVGYINVIWSGITTMLMLAIGYFFFNERLSMIEWIGTFFVITGIALMTIHNIEKH